MKIIKILLVLIFAATAALYTVNGLSNALSHTDEGPVLLASENTLEISVLEDQNVLMTGVTATDAQDGDLTDRIIISGISKLTGDHTARVTYVVFDSDDNMATLVRPIRYTDYRGPRFSLEEPLRYSSTQNITLLDRLHAEDVIDGDITDFIRVSYTQETNDPEIYTVDVQVTNSMGDTAWQTLPVIVQSSDTVRPIIHLNSYLVYLERGSELLSSTYIDQVTYGNGTLSTQAVKIAGEVDTNTPGTYMLTYSTTYNGTTGTAILTIVVE